jgi:hypothetical protein
MPSTLTGLLIFVALLVPGFVHYTWRRRTVPLRPDSTLVETANLVTVSLLANVLALGLFGIGRAVRPNVFLDPRELIRSPGEFIADNLLAASITGVGLLVTAVGIAWAIAARVRPISKVASWFTPAIVDAPGWFHVFESATPEQYVHVGCTLAEGGYISGIVDWYSTEVEESDHRSLVLAPPFHRVTGEGEVETSAVERIVLSARDIRVMEVTYLTSLEW